LASRTSEASPQPTSEVLMLGWHCPSLLPVIPSPSLATKLFALE
jgi:hypothetical protein